MAGNRDHGPVGVVRRLAIPGQASGQKGYLDEDFGNVVR
ncbi:hypothetical protein BB170200_01789 [Mycobacterium marinum]|nr:hypothetical protein BB170200_01789 [Mycobacterium marinum]